MKAIQLPPGTPSNPSRSNISSRRRRNLTLRIPPRDTSLAVLLPLPPSTASTSHHSNNSVGIQHQNVFSELERVNRIGSGTGGTVYKVIHRPSGRLYALKVIFGHPEEAVRRQICREIEILRDVKDPNVVNCFEMDDRNGEIQLLLELMDGGSLEGVLIQNEQQLSKLTFQILSGLAYLHRRRIVHRDIKPSNVLVNSQNKVKIADFGVSRVLEQTMDPCNSSVGTIAYMSPERINTDLNHGKYDGYAGDIWSFGVSILEFYLGRFPFAVGKQGDWASLMCAICMADPPRAPTTASLEFRDFIGRCLQRDPAKRWTATQLLRHPFIVQHNLVQLPNLHQFLLPPPTAKRIQKPPKTAKKVIDQPPSVVDATVKLPRPSLLTFNRDRFIVSESNQFPMSHQPDTVDAETRKRPHKISKLTTPATHVSTHPINFRSLVQQLTGFRPGPVDISQPAMLDPLSSSSADSDRGRAADAGESMDYHHVESIDIPEKATLSSDISTLTVDSDWTSGPFTREEQEMFLWMPHPNSISDFMIAREQDMSLNQDSNFISNPLIGVERKVEEVENLLQVGVSDIRTVGIYGSGGIGKTSLAKLVFDRISTHFEGCSFLQDIRETTRQFGGLENMQTKLKRECVEIGSSDEGICYIREVLCDMRVLVVLDNVDSGFCLDRFVGDVDSFGPGSRIIVIARSKTDLPKCTETYEVLKMNDQEAFTLFTTHAFKDSTSSCRINLWDVNHVLSQKILCAIGRIPLAVEVIGSLLSREPVDKWGSTPEKLEDFHDEGLQRRLKLSYDALSDQQKKIFLDVACFINGEDSRISSYLWHESAGDTVLSEGLKGLVSLSLVKIGDNNELLMHDELRELGRELVCQEELSGTEKMNRFLIQVRDFAALLVEKDLGRVEALSLCFDKQSQYQDSDFRKMPSLRFLKMADADMCGDFSDVFTNLRWLHWEGCPKILKATNFHLKSLIILNLSRSKVTSIWEGWSQIKATNSLKVLNLTGCMNLITTPNLSNFPNLERLILEQCSSLVCIDPSIQCLEKLQFLNLKFCTELNMLPKELGSLKALTEILIDGTSIRYIPISIGHLVSLETLSASSCVSLSHLPSSISYLTSLSELTLDGAQIHELPDLIGELKILRKLSLKDCRWMQKLPDSIKKLKDSLIQLDISGTGISEFMNSIQDLQRLKVLRMNSCFIRVFPKAICYLSNLEELHASHCRSLESDIPPEIERLRSLKILRLGFSRISTLPLSICNLPCLQTLELDHCNMLSMLPRLPSSLSWLCFSSRRMVKFPNLLGMQNLEELILADSDSEELLIRKKDFEGKYFWIPDLPKLKAMELHHSGIHSIRGGKYCPLLRKLTLSCPNLELFYALHLPLLTLSIHHCRSLESLEVASFQCLVELQVLDSAVRRIRGLRSLKSLQVLNVSKCQVEHLDGLEMLSSLVRLTVSHCEYLQKLPSLSKLVLLRSLVVSYCDSLESLPNLSQLEMLKEVKIHCCKKLSEIHGLEDLKSLEKIQVN